MPWALVGEIPFARGSGVGGALMQDIFFHPPDGRFGGLVVGGRSPRLAQLLGQLSSLFGEKALLFRQLPSPGFQRVKIIAVPRHDGRLS